MKLGLVILAFLALAAVACDRDDDDVVEVAVFLECPGESGQVGSVQFGFADAHIHARFGGTAEPGSFFRAGNKVARHLFGRCWGSLDLKSVCDSCREPFIPAAIERPAAAPEYLDPLSVRIECMHARGRGPVDDLRDEPQLLEPGAAIDPEGASTELSYLESGGSRTLWLSVSNGATQVALGFDQCSAEGTLLDAARDAALSNP